MAPTITKAPLSSSSHGLGIKVSTAAPLDGSDTAVHTATAGTIDTNCDYVTIYAANLDTSAIELSLGIGGTTDPDNTIKLTIPYKAGLTLVILDLPLRNSQTIVASAATVNKLVLYGHVKQVR